jgi:hypothetical protein
MVKVMENQGNQDLSSFHDLDHHHLVSPSRLPLLNNSHELAEYRVSKKQRNEDILKQCMVLHLESCVTHAQKRSIVPAPAELVQLPVFKQAREIDILDLHASHARRKELLKEEERRRLEEERLEAERRLEREKVREEQRKKRLEAKELRRQERMEAKRERLAVIQEKKMRQYEEAYEKWERNLKEQRATLDAAQEKIKTLESLKIEREGSLKTFDVEKEDLLESLRSAAVRADSVPATGKIDSRTAGSKDKARNAGDLEKTSRVRSSSIDRERSTVLPYGDRDRERVSRNDRREREYENRVKSLDRDRDTRTSRDRVFDHRDDVPIVSKGDREIRDRYESGSSSLRERDRDVWDSRRVRDLSEKKPVGIRDRGGARYMGGPGSPPGMFARAGGSIRDQRPRSPPPHPYNRDKGSGYSIRRGPPVGARYVADADRGRDGPPTYQKYIGSRGPRDRPGSGYSNRGDSRGR